MKNIYVYEKMHLKYTYSTVSISPSPSSSVLISKGVKLLHIHRAAALPGALQRGGVSGTNGHARPARSSQPKELLFLWRRTLTVQFIDQFS